MLNCKNLDLKEYMLFLLLLLMCYNKALFVYGIETEMKNITNNNLIKCNDCL